MANKRHKPEEIVSKMRQVEVLLGTEITILDRSRTDQPLSRRSPTLKH